MASCAFVVLIGTIAASNPSFVTLPPPERAAKAYEPQSPAVLSAAAPSGPAAVPAAPEPTVAPEATVPPPPPPEPTPLEVSADGPGSFQIVPGETPVAGTGKLLRYTVELEDGLPFDPAAVAQTVDSTLADSRSWISTGRNAFQRTEDEPDVRIVVATPGTTDELCAPLKTRGEVSCHNGEFVVLNAKRWAFGVESYNGDIDNYRRYLVNHEIGHALGHGHVPCPGAGELAPVMLQQTYGLDGCLPNAWPAAA
jgi:Protein of unknown function (DUF3152)